MGENGKMSKEDQQKSYPTGLYITQTLVLAVSEVGSYCTIGVTWFSLG
jgi:hypothetical protein